MATQQPLATMEISFYESSAKILYRTFPPFWILYHHPERHWYLGETLLADDPDTTLYEAVGRAITYLAETC